MICDSSSLSSGTRRVWIIPQKRLSLQQRPWSDHIVGCSTAALLSSSSGPLTSCLFSSICLPCSSPKEASIKSPLKTRMGLDSYKLEQNNLFPKPHCGLTSPCPFLSVPYRQRQKPRALLWDREQFLFTDAHYIDVSWFHQATHLDAIPPAASHCLPSTPYVFTPNASAMTRQTAWQSAELQPLLWLLISARATM